MPARAAGTWQSVLARCRSASAAGRALGARLDRSVHSGEAGLSGFEHAPQHGHQPAGEALAVAQPRGGAALGGLQLEKVLASEQPQAEAAPPAQLPPTRDCGGKVRGEGGGAGGGCRGGAAAPFPAGPPWLMSLQA